MTLTFYYSPMSTASITELMIEELGVPCEKVRVHFDKGDTKQPAFLALNPNGKVPLIVHDGTPIWESVAITMYLGELFGVDRQLYPAPGPARGVAMKWLVWCGVTLGDAVSRWTRNTLEWTPAEQHNAAAAAAALKEIAGCLRILDTALADRPFLVGDAYTLADGHLNSFLDWLRHMKVDFAGLDHLAAWSARCATRPAAVKLMASLGL
jgi:glutathione S-transferase